MLHVLQILFTCPKGSEALQWSSYIWRRGTVPIWWGVELRQGGVGEATINVNARNPYRGTRRCTRSSLCSSMSIPSWTHALFVAWHCILVCWLACLPAQNCNWWPDVSWDWSRRLYNPRDLLKGSSCVSPCFCKQQRARMLKMFASQVLPAIAKTILRRPGPPIGRAARRRCREWQQPHRLKQGR